MNVLDLIYIYCIVWSAVSVFAPAVEVGIVTARGGGLFTWSLPFSYFCLGVGGVCF